METEHAVQGFTNLADSNSGSSCESVHFEGLGRPSKRLRRLGPGERRRSERWPHGAVLPSVSSKGFPGGASCVLPCTFPPVASSARPPFGLAGLPGLIQRPSPLFACAGGDGPSSASVFARSRLRSTSSTPRRGGLAFLESGPSAPGRRLVRFAPRTNPSSALHRFTRQAGCPITRQGIGGIGAEGEECAKGGVRLRGLCPWSGKGPEGQAERSVWLCQRNAEEKPLPVQEKKLFRREAPTPPKARPIHRGIWAYCGAARAGPPPGRMAGGGGDGPQGEEARTDGAGHALAL
jgi:hypothetical protein